MRQRVEAGRAGCGQWHSKHVQITITRHATEWAQTSVSEDVVRAGGSARTEALFSRFP